MTNMTDDGPRSLTADLHIHSALSPCAEDRMTPDQVLTKLVSFDVDVFSITDHNSWFNCAAFAEAARSRDMLFIPGIELQSAEEIHLLAYFPDIGDLSVFHSTTVKPALMRGMVNRPEIFGSQLKIDGSGECLGEEEAMLSMPLALTVEELVAHVHNYNGIAVAAHIDKGFSVVSQLGFIPPDLLLDAVEVHDPTKIDSIRKVYLKDRTLNVISSSDSHYIDMMCRPKMRLRPRELDARCCLECIRDGEGEGVIIRECGKGRQKGMKAEGDADGGSKKDWKSMYG